MIAGIGHRPAEGARRSKSNLIIGSARKQVTGGLAKSNPVPFFTLHLVIVSEMISKTPIRPNRLHGVSVLLKASLAVLQRDSEAGNSLSNGPLDSAAQKIEKCEATRYPLPLPTTTMAYLGLSIGSPPMRDFLSHQY